MPRVLEAMSRQNGAEGPAIVTDTCLRGGASLASLMREGNGMSSKFATANAKRVDGSFDVGQQTVEALLSRSGGWNAVVLNDYSQAPSKPKNHAKGLKTLVEQILPLAEKANARICLMETAAYRKHAKGSEELGSWEEFKSSQIAGYRAYSDAIEIASKGYAGGVARLPTVVVPVNLAFAAVREERFELWSALFADDDFHPAALGTYLQACLVYAVLFDVAPPPPPPPMQSEASIGGEAVEGGGGGSSHRGGSGGSGEYSTLFAAARIAPVGKEGTHEEYEYLRSIAIKITGVGVSEKAVVDDTLEPPSAKTEKIGAAL